MPNTVLQIDQTEWLQKAEQSLHAIDIIGRKLIIGRSTCRNPGSELILIQLEVSVYFFMLASLLLSNIFLFFKWQFLFSKETIFDKS